jgi:hypothetical protein
MIPHKQYLPYAFYILLIAVSCGKDKPGQPATAFRPEQPATPADALFQKMNSAETGIAFVNNIQETHELNIVTDAYLYNGGGVGVLDVNQDGLQDLFFTSTMGKCKLYLNKGGLKFEDIAQSAGTEAPLGQKTGVTIVDINADGWQDIYLCRTTLKPNENSRNLLFINNQNNTFTESARAYGLADDSPSNHANFFDCDNDGDLDCYLINHPVDYKNVSSVRVRDVGNGRTERMVEPQYPFESNRLYLNNGNNTFTDVTKKAGVYNRAFSLSVTVSDLNGDGYKDVLVGNDYIDPDFVYLNNPHQPGNFSDKVNTVFRHHANHTMGVDFGDINNDGLNDFMALDMLAEPAKRRQELMNTMTLDRQTTLTKYGYGNQQMRNMLQLNNGNGTFSDIGCLAGVFQTDWSWSSLIQDYDNDGWRDIFVANGYLRDMSNLDYINFTVDSVMRNGGLSPKTIPDIYEFLNLIPSTPIQNYCYKNRGDLTFENVSTAWGFTDLNYSNGAVYADLDNDGDLDMVINNLNSEALVYKNRALENNKGSWLQLKLVGAAPNTFAIGAKVRVKVGNNVYVDELTPTRGFFSSVELLLHFGLGTAQEAEVVEVEFPGNKIVSLQKVRANQRITVDIAQAKPGTLSPSSTVLASSFKEIIAPVFSHKEDDIQDFNNERLLPWKLSCPGPCLAVGDVNGDGLDDCYIGNAAGATGGLFLQKNGSFQASTPSVWEADKQYEDTGCLFFDADGDKDLDLLVASGGNSFPANAPNYTPRIYLNDGKGNFSRKTSGVPPAGNSTFAVSACDFDGDGDQDLFFGGWCVPGKYPAAPASMVWLNDKGNFTDATDRVAPFFKNLGLVRAMTWADFDGDNKAELLVAGEWMPLRIFGVTNGKLEDLSAKYGLNGTEGFWRSLQAADLDGDGDLDFVAGNIGLNTRYTASADAPLRMYAKDFDGNGSMDPIMTQMEGAHEFPVATREVLIKQLPGLRKKFVRTIHYAQASIKDIYPEKDLQSALTLRCNILASTIFMNENGTFVAKKLPNEAQISPTNAIQLFDWQNDGDLDILVVGNDYGQQVESGRLDAGSGLLLENNGKANFIPIVARKSGFWANREARDLKMVRSGAGKSMFLVANNNSTPQLFQLTR